MFDEKTLKNFCEIVLTTGVALCKNQNLEIVCPVEKHIVAETMANVAYSLGAKFVRVRWEDEIIDKINYLNADKEVLATVPKWQLLYKNQMVEENYCYVAISAEDPKAFIDVPADKLAYVNKARAKAFKKFSDIVMKNGIRWCVVSVPTKKWAEQVFPNSPNPEEELSRAIIKSMRLDLEDPVLEWQRHIKKLEHRAEFLNSKNLEYLLFENSIGTNLMVGLAQNYLFLSAKEKANDGVGFVANMPTEEVFTAPHNKKIFGTVKSALPLSYNGQIVDQFSLTFDKGKIIDYSAKIGQDVLANIINTDKGTRSLGEVALIGKNSPIAQSNTLFYNTLFDENASCHLAFGQGYPTTVKNGQTLTKRELANLGVNDSTEHVDFMIGTKDLKITGIDYDGNETLIFNDGDWAI